MINKISNIVNSHKCYNFLCKTVPIVYEESNDLFLHNKKRMEFYNRSQNTFEGYMSCGGTTYLLHYYLLKNNINTKLGLKSFGYGKYLEDHCFLYSDNIIIDPTYRQIFRQNVNGDSFYKNYLYNLPFIFVGTYDDLDIIYNDLDKFYYKEFNNPLEDNKLYFWKNFKDNSKKLDCPLVVDDIDYAISKGSIYYNLYNFFNKS